MPNIIDILARALSLRQETALNSITPNRAGGIMYDTLLVLNQMQLEGGSLLISKVYASVSAMEADTTPTSDLTGRALKPGQLVVIVTSDSSSSDMGSEYRFNGPGSWTYVGKVGGLPLDTVPTQSSTKGITSGGVYTALAAMKAEGYKYMGLATPGSGGTAPGTPNQPVFYIAGPGSYPNFGSITVASGYLGFIKYSGGSWSVESVAVGKDYDEQISTLDGQISQLEAKVDGNEFALFNEGKLSAKYVANEYVNQNTGAFVEFNGWSRTDYINVSPFKTLQINATRASVYNAFYKKDKSFLSGFALVVGDNTINVPEDASYIVLSTTTADVVNNVITIDESRYMDEKQTDDKIASASVVSNNEIVNQVIREVFFNFDLSSLISIRLYKSGDVRRFMFDPADYGEIQLILRNDGSFIGLDYATLSIIKCFGVMDVSKFDEYAGATYYPVVFRDWCMLPTSSPIGILEELAKPSNIRAISFTKTTGKRINTDGEVVDAGSSWFYTSPVQFKRGDVVSLHDIVGNSSVSIASFVITEGTEYTPVSNLKYSGIDGDNYTFVVEKDGSLSFSLNNGDSHYPCIYAISSDTISSLVDLIKTSQSGIRVVDNLTEGGHNDALSAEQGKNLKRLSDLNGNINDYPCVPSPVFKPYISRMPIDPASWSAGNNGTIDADMVEIFDEVNKCYRKSIKMNCYPLASGNNYSIFSATLSSPVNIKTTSMVGSIYLDPAIADADRGSILIRLYSGGNTANSATIYLWYLVDSSAGRTLYSRNYWYHFAINAYAAINSKTSGFDETDVTGVAIIYQNGYDTSPFIAISDFGFVNTLHKPAISIVVDNYNPSVPDMADYAASKGVKLTTTIVPSYIGGAGSASLERIKDGKLQGNIIGNHTWSHQASMTTEAEYVDEIVKAERYMLANGFARGCKFVSVPSATFNNLKYIAYCQTDAQMIYHNWIKGPSSIVDYPFYPCQREHNITVVDNNPATPEAAAAVVVTMKSNIQDAITYKGMAVLGFHGTFWEADNGVAWKDLIDYISELSNVDIVTVDELIEGTIV